MITSVLEEEKCVKQYNIWKVFPLLMKLISMNIQAKILQKLPTIPTVPTPSTIKVIVSGQLPQTIYTVLDHTTKWPYYSPLSLERQQG